MLWQPTRGILQPNQSWRRPQTVAAGGVTVDATGTKKYKSASTSFSDATVITVGSGNTLVVTLSMGYSGSAPTSLTATWNATSMTKIVQQDRSTGNVTCCLFGLRSPAAGANTLALSWTNSAEVFVDAISFSGVNVTSDGTAFPHTAIIDTGGGTVALTSATGNYAVATQSPNSGSVTLTGTTLYLDSANGIFINSGANYDVGAATVTIGLASGPTNLTLAAVDVSA